MIYARKLRNYRKLYRGEFAHGYVAVVELLQIEPLLDYVAHELLHLFGRAACKRTRRRFGCVGNHDYRRYLRGGRGPRIRIVFDIQLAVAHFQRLGIEILYRQRAVVLHCDFGEKLGQVRLPNQRSAVARVRTDYIDRKLGRELVVHVVIGLVFGEHFGIFELADVVVIRRRARKFGIFAYRLGARLCNSCHRHRVVIGARRILFEPLYQLCLVGGEFAQPEHGEFGEHYLEYRQQEHINEHREEGRKRAVHKQQQRFGELLGHRSFQQGDYNLYRNEQHEREEHAAYPRLYSGRDENANHARAERENEEIIALGRAERGYVGKVIENEHLQGEDDIQKNRLAPAEKRYRHEREKRHGTRRRIDKFAYKKGKQKRYGEQQEYFGYLPDRQNEFFVFEIEVAIHYARDNAERHAD